MLQSMLMALAMASMTASAATDDAIVLKSLPGSIPSAAAHPDDARGEALCSGEGRPAESDEDRALVEAGFIPFFATQQIGTTRVVPAASWLDGSCRPSGVAVFVFRAGKAVGRIGFPDPSAVPTLRLNDAGTLVVEVDVRKADDAHCCPTGKATMVVGIDDAGIRRAN
ncbi:hypothetical protein ACQQ2N_01555 [Dokdonella sp. MW10]|uniref:hypothetical protein n=1 Tax=Dokdonella sp. MW10 TaxID=2992926 RepID=UPI003F81AEDE